MSDVLERQLALEEEYSTLSLIKGQEQVLNAFSQGRAADISEGRLILAKAYSVGVERVQEYLAKPMSGLGGKYKKLLKIASTEVIVMAALREILNGCANPEQQPIQNVLRGIGRVIESESMLECMQGVNARYTERTVEYLDAAGTKSVHHRYRTFLAGAENMGLEWERWSTAERVGVARVLLNELYEVTGLFKWSLKAVTDGSPMYYLTPTETLEKHFKTIAEAARAVVKFPPMFVPPMDWEGQSSGGYLTDWFRHHAPMCGLRYMKKADRDWVINGLNSPESAPVRNAMNKAQNVPYRVNNKVLEVLRKAVAMRVGILGLPSFVPLPQPVFSLGDNWQKDEASVAELEQFKLWKQMMSAWYTAENKRRGRNIGILVKLTELTRYKDEAALYFPTFIDWRGRLYFRSHLNPQAADSVKGCLEFAEGKVLGERGLFWLKAHVANCCGYDKHDPTIKVKWTEDNWNLIEDFINNPLDVDAPDADTAFTLLQAGLALQESLSLSDPTQYVCHVPVAMDATCSGLQHLSALTRDPIGAYYTNLQDNGGEQKSDIYVRVAELADESKEKYCTRRVKTDNGIEVVQDSVLKHYWKERPITRSMSKAPVMTYVYGSTLISTIDTISLDMSDAGMSTVNGDDGKIIYSLPALATPVGKALRHGVIATVPEATRIMKYLQTLVRKHKDTCLRWVSPVGVPVVNWAAGTTDKQVHIKSMGIRAIVLRSGTQEYSTRSAADGIVPNFVHSMDAGHLCTTINEHNGVILPIHDSVGTHPSDVDSMHSTLRSTFVNMYQEYNITALLDSNNIDVEAFEPPEQGSFNLEDVKQSRFMFG